MSVDADKTDLPIATRWRRVAVLALVAGVLTTMISGMIGLSIAMVISQGHELAVSEAEMWVTQVVFAAYMGFGLLLGIGGWRLMVGDGLGHSLTRYSALAAAMLTALCLVTSVIDRGSFDYSLVLLTAPLVTYSAIVYAMRGTSPERTGP